MTQTTAYSRPADGLIESIPPPVMMNLTPQQKDLVGAAGGVFMAICLIPQLARMWQTKSARDLSYSWTLFYIIGLSFTGLYLYLEGATVGWISALVEQVLAWVVVFGKVYLDSRDKNDSLEADIARQLPPSVAVQDSQEPMLRRLSKSYSMQHAPTVPLLAKGPAQHGACHLLIDYILGDKDGLPEDGDLSQQILTAVQEAVTETKSSRLRFKHVEFFEPTESEPDQSAGFSLVAISGEGHVTADWYSVHGLLSISLLSSCQEHLAATTKRLGVVLHRKLRAELPSLEFVKASTQLIAELQA
ncbi:hypothetical protein WJX73_000427 [Symbiochloris irregularis]|uniref:Uncharacterized protein n=1 Tax=Symbiochloris irregularis TaxID=706552 RepID=A0AAW1NPC5_9CHLO